MQVIIIIKQKESGKNRGYWAKFSDKNEKSY
jgi:hypothetical protein